MGTYVTNRVGKLVDHKGRVVTGGPATKKESPLTFGPGGKVTLKYKGRGVNLPGMNAAMSVSGGMGGAAEKAGMAAAKASRNIDARIGRALGRGKFEEARALIRRFGGNEKVLERDIKSSKFPKAKTALPPKQMKGDRLEAKMEAEVGAKRVGMAGRAGTQRRRSDFIPREKVGEAGKQRVPRISRHGGRDLIKTTGTKGGTELKHVTETRAPSLPRGEARLSDRPKVGEFKSPGGGARAALDRLRQKKGEIGGGSR